jgi:hypothetical protein
LAALVFVFAMAHVWLHNAHAADDGHFGEQTFAQCLLSKAPPATASDPPSLAAPWRLILPVWPATDQSVRSLAHNWCWARAPPFS